MKTLLTTLEYPPFKGGVANYYGNLVDNWLKEESIEVLSNNKGELFSGHGPLPWFKGVVKIWKKRKNKAFNYLLVGHILPLGTAAYLVSLFKPFPYAVILHGLDFSSAIISPRKRFISKLILRRADKVICANSYVKDLVLEFDKKLENKIHICNPGVVINDYKVSEKDKEQIKKEYNLEDKFVLFTLGRLVLRKGFDKVIEALSKIKEENIVYFIAGEGEEKGYLMEMAKSLNVEDKVHFLGAISEEDKLNWLNVSSAFIMPSRQIGIDFEGFGIVYLEANLAGKPVIAGDSGGVKDAVVDGLNGILVNPNNEEEIKNAILKLKNNSELGIELGKNGEKRVREKFSWEKQAKIFFDIIYR